ncbi:MAG: transcriptional regulator [Nitrosopumilaceae archaeon]|nr:transcriptional regulator [Nitrosopumilaceae archaeon]
MVLKRRLLGITIFILCIITFFLYAYLVMLSEWSPIVLQLSMLMIAGGILGALSWLGYTMATTRPSKSFITSDENK